MWINIIKSLKMNNRSIHDAMWICADENISSPRIKTCFKLKKKLEKAVLQVTGLGYFEAYINGRKVSDDVLIPAQTDYENRELKNMRYPMNYECVSHRVLFLEYDVKNLIGHGENILGIWLGNGFYRQTLRKAEGNVSYGYPKTIACLQMKYEDGDSEYIMTEDENWYFRESPIFFNNIFFGEKYDSRLEEPDWCHKDGTFDGWSQAKIANRVGGKLKKQNCPTDRIQESYDAKLLKKDGDRYIFDIGQNISGRLNITVSGKIGQTVKARFSGRLHDDLRLDYQSTCSKDNQIQEMEYILNDKPVQDYTQKFVWYGFRYFEVITKSNLIAVKAEFVGTKLDITGDFKCSNLLLNRLYELYLVTQRANLHGCITSDCPHRERLSYTGDGQLVTEPLMLSFDGYSFIRKWIDDLKDGQNKKTGHVAHTVPFMGGGGGPAWGSAIIIVPWRYYLQTGDLSVLREMYEPMCRWMEYLETRTDDDFIIHREEPGGWCLGDWCAPGKTEISEEYVNTCVYAHNAELMKKIVRILGKDTERFENLNNNIKQAIKDNWYSVENNCFSKGRQGANALALWACVLPEGQAQKVAKTMAEHIENDCNGHLDTGIIATPILLDMLTKYGYVDIAYGIMTKETYPSFGFMLKNGATTLCERFEYIESDNHPMFGTYTSWFIKSLAGIKTDEDSPGYKNVIISPNFSKGLDFVESKVRTVSGEYVKVRWEKIKNRVIVEINLPKKSSYSFVEPNRYVVLSKKTDGDKHIVELIRK